MGYTSVTLRLGVFWVSYVSIQFGASIWSVYMCVGPGSVGPGYGSTRVGVLWDLLDPGMGGHGSEGFVCGIPTRRAQQAAGQGFGVFRVPGHGSGETRIRSVFE